MSRGPGIWQRRILDTLEKYPAFYLMDLLPKDHTRSQVVALNRAARQLASNYKIETLSWWTRFGKGGFITVLRPGYSKPTVKDIPRVSVAHVAPGEACNTYETSVVNVAAGFTKPRCNTYEAGKVVTLDRDDYREEVAQ
jgi:hypothetical protein